MGDSGCRSESAPAPASRVPPTAGDKPPRLRSQLRTRSRVRDLATDAAYLQRDREIQKYSRPKTQLTLAYSS